MKLKNLKTQAVYANPITVAVVHPSTGLPIGVEIDVYGDGSAQAQAAQDTVARESLALMQKANRAAAVDPARARDKATDVLAACTVGWRDLKGDAELPEFSVAAAKTLYSDYDWIAEQVIDARTDKTRFFGRPATG